MGAISSEIVHWLKVRLSLQHDQRWLLLLYRFSKISGGGPPHPPSRLENMLFIFRSNTAQHKHLVKMGNFQLGIKQQKSFSIDLW